MRSANPAPKKARSKKAIPAISKAKKSPVKMLKRSKDTIKAPTPPKLISTTPPKVVNEEVVAEEGGMVNRRGRAIRPPKRF